MTTGSSLLDCIKHQVEKESFTLPVLNRTCFQLQAMVSKHNCDLRELETLIMRDQALATDVLRAANSAFFGGLSEVNTIRSAVMRIGVKEVLKIVFLVSERTKYHARDPLLGSMVRALWQHASASAAAADWLACRLKHKAREEAFLAGLLHDIGELVVLRALDEFKTSENPAMTLSPALVTEIMTSTHTELGFNFLARRRIPEVYCRIAHDHHQEKVDQADALMAMIRLSDLAARKLGLSLRPDASILLAATSEAACLGVDDIVLAELEVMLEDFQAVAA